MAKVQIEFDTEEKQMTCSIDGAVVPDVTDLVMYQSYDNKNSFNFELVSISHDDTTKIRKMTRLMASESTKAKETTTAPSPYPGFVVETDNRSKLEQDIAAFFSRK